MLKTLTFFVLSMLLLLGAAHAQETDPRKDLQIVQDNLKASADAQAKLAREMVEAAKAQELLSTQLVSLTSTALQQEQAVADAEQRLLALTTEKATAELSLAEKRDSLSKLLAGLQRLEQNPPPALVVAPDDTLNALRGAMLLGTIVPEFKAQAEALKAELVRLKQLDETVNAARDQAFASLAILEDTREQIGSLLAEKKKLAAANLTNISSERQRARDLAAKATSFKNLIATLEAEKAKELQRLAAEEEAAAKAETERLAALAKPTMVLSKSKGKLQLPVQGHILRNFGDETSDGRRLTGQYLAASVGGFVISPVDGTVEFAGPFMSYDQLVIINAGESYLVLLAGMVEISVSPGETVKAGSPMGKMGERTAASSQVLTIAEHAGPVLYVEFRRKQESVDPAPWWQGFRKEAKR
jgi:murein hydrolase activator